MFVLGFQEIVPLTAQQIVQTDPEKKYVPMFAVETQRLSPSHVVCVTVKNFVLLKLSICLPQPIPR